VPDRPGWGTEPHEDALAAHPPKASKRSGGKRRDPGITILRSTAAP
jgi:hypothetical protein